jgi:hypothetical protein
MALEDPALTGGAEVAFFVGPGPWARTESPPAAISHPQRLANIIAEPLLLTETISRFARITMGPTGCPE